MELKYLLWPAVLCVSLLLIDAQEAGNSSRKPENVYSHKLNSSKTPDGLGAASSHSKAIETQASDKNNKRPAIKIQENDI